MDSIITRAIPSCIRCNTAGKILQDGIHDPDGLIPGDWRYRQCENPQCGLVWLDPAPLAEELWKAYTQYHTHTQIRPGRLLRISTSLFNRLCRIILWPFWIKNGLWRESRRVRLMFLNQQPPGKLLDIGCGGGRFLRRMQRLGWQVSGIDFDEQATQRIKRKLGIETYTGNLIDADLSQACFDAIAMSHTIEHLVDPVATLRECFRILKPGGQITIVTPNVESHARQMFGPFWRGWEPPRHLYLFSIGTLKQFLIDSGFEVENIKSSAASSAITYRVSMNLQHPEHANAIWKQLKLIPWSYRLELRDHKTQFTNKRVAQNLIAIAKRPLS